MAGTTMPPNMNAVIHTESTEAHTLHMFEVKTNIANSNNIVRHSVAKSLDEPSPAQARAIDKILRLPKA